MTRHDEFAVHMLNTRGKAAAGQIADAFDECLSKLEGIVGEHAPYMQISKLKLEEACFFAKKAMATQLHFTDEEPTRIASPSDYPTPSQAHD
jgi:hypothetical protein